MIGIIILLITLLFLTFYYFFSIKNKEEVDINKTGDWIEYYPSGKIKKTETYLKGLKNGIWIKYFADSTTEEIVEYKNDKRDGEYKLYQLINNTKNYTTETALLLSGLYKDGVKTGVWLAYHKNSKVLKEKTFFENGIINGERTCYHINGEISGISNHNENGKEVGKSIGYYDNGDISYIKNFSEIGVLKSIEFYYLNNKRKEIQNHEINKSIMVDDSNKYYYSDAYYATKFYENGNISEKGLCVGSEKKVGYWEYYYENGQLETKGEYTYSHFKGSTKVNSWTRYFENGQIQKESVIVEKNIIKDIHYYSNSQVQKEILYKNKFAHGECKEFYENGQLKSTKYFDKGLPVNEWKEFYENGQLKSTKYFDKGLPVNEWKEFYEDGIVFGEGDYNQKHKGPNKNSRYNFSFKWINYYSNGQIKTIEYRYNSYWRDYHSTFYNSDKGKRYGLYQSFYQNGNLESEGMCEDDKKILEWKYFNIDGKLNETIRTWLYDPYKEFK